MKKDEIMSVFITFEGGEGCGKTLQAKSLYRSLRRRKIPALLTHEPGGTPLGEKLTRLLKWGKSTDISPISEVMLFNASRSQLVANVIRPSLAAGKIVVCDRFTDSTIAYQGYGRRLDLQMIEEANSFAADGLSPDFTILLDLPVETGFARKKGSLDRFEVADRNFHQRVRDGFLKMAADEPERWFIIDGSLSVVEIEAIVWEKVQGLLRAAKK
jgi:dTMP kinase